LWFPRKFRHLCSSGKIVSVSKLSINFSHFKHPTSSSFMDIQPYQSEAVGAVLDTASSDVGCKVRMGLQRWREQLTRVKQYLTTHQKAPSKHSKTPDLKALGSWIASQKTNYAKNVNVLSNPAIRQEWDNALADPVYGLYLKSKDNEQDWRCQLAKVKQYLATHQKSPSSKKAGTKTLSLWIFTQKINYSKNAQIMSNPDIRQEWENTLADPAYWSYLKPRDREQDWRDQLARVKQYFTVHQKAPSLRSQNPDTKTLANWIRRQKATSAKSARSNPNTRAEWESTLADPAYGSYLKPQDNQQNWLDQLDQQYPHQPAPSSISLDPDIPILGSLIGTPKQDHSENTQIVPNPTISQNTLVDPAYEPYLVHLKRKSDVDRTAEPCILCPKKAKLSIL
jgi:hypothetical protein